MKLTFWKNRLGKTSGKKADRGIRILMVDDEESFLRLTKRNLEAEGFIVETQNKARAAVESARAFKPDLILLDVMMPDGDGGEVASQIAEDPEIGKTPVMFLTAAIKGSEVGSNGAACIGGRFYIAKPVQIDDLVQYIDDRLACSA